MEIGAAFRHHSELVLGAVIPLLAMPTFLLLPVGLLFLAPFLQTMRKCLDEIAPQHRTIEPSAVWWNLIPIFNLVWLFVTAHRLAESVNREARARRVRTGERPLHWGVAMAVLFVMFTLTAALPFVSMLLFGLWVFALAMYWKCVAKLLIGFAGNQFPGVD